MIKRIFLTLAFLLISVVSFAKSSVVVYGIPNCPACVQEKAILKKMGVKYTYIDVSRKPIRGILMVPVVEINGKKLRPGLVSEEELKRILGK